MSAAQAAGRIIPGAELAELSAHEVDFAIVGSGAGGGVAAAVLAATGAKVAVVEEGGHYTRTDFNMQEAWAYPALYQEHGNRATDDLAIMILQGRNVGGGTTVNWTSSFRTPPATLRLWAERPRHPRSGRRDAGAALRGGGGAPGRRPRKPRRRQRQQPEAAGRRRQARLQPGADSPQRQGLRAARLLRHGLPARRQADVAHHLPGRRDRRRHGRLLRLPREAGRDRSRTRARRRRRGAGSRRRSPRGPAGHPRRKGGAGRRRHQRTTPAAALAQRAPTAAVGKRTFLHPTVPIVAFYDQPIEGFWRAAVGRCTTSPIRGGRVGTSFGGGARPPDAGAIAARLRRRPSQAGRAVAVRAGHHRAADRRPPRRRRRPRRRQQAGASAATRCTRALRAKRRSTRSATWRLQLAAAPPR